MGVLSDADFGDLRVFKSPVNGKAMKLHGFRGNVVGANSYSETSVHSSGGQAFAGANGAVISTPVRIHSSITRGTKFFLKDGDVEKNFNIIDCLDMRDGHDVSVVWGVVDGRETGEYVVIINSTTGEKRVLVNGIANALSLRLGPSDLVWTVMRVILSIALFVFFGITVYVIQTIMPGNVSKFLDNLYPISLLSSFIVCLLLPFMRKKSKLKGAYEGYVERINQVAKALS